MSVLIRVDHEKETVHLPVHLRSVWKTDLRMVAQSKAHDPDSWTTDPDHTKPNWQLLAVRGVKVNDLSPLWPAGHFRNHMLRGAHMAVEQLAERGYDLNIHEGDMQIFGPWKEKPWDRVASEGIVVGAQDELGAQATDECDFLIYGWFLAKQGYTSTADHEILAAHAGKLYDEALAKTNNDVLAARLLLPKEALPESAAARIAVQLVDERERKAARAAGVPWQ